MGRLQTDQTARVLPWPSVMQELHHGNDRLKRWYDKPLCARCPPGEPPTRARHPATWGKCPGEALGLIAGGAPPTIRPPSDRVMGPPSERRAQLLVTVAKLFDDGGTVVGDQ